MQVVDRSARRADFALSRAALAAERDLRLTTLTALLQTHGSGYSREYVRNNVLGWAARRWPEFFVGRSACEPNFERYAGRARVRVTTTSKGAYKWSFSGRHPDEHSHRDWETRVLLIGDEEHDLLVVRNGHFGSVDFPGLVLQPRFLPLLVEHLEFDDGGFSVRTTPRMVPDRSAFENFFDHLMSTKRTLPILAVEHSPDRLSPPGAGGDPGLDALSLARKVWGLAHVVSLGPAGSVCLKRRLGQKMAVHAGEARLFMPGVGETLAAEAHPRFATAPAANNDIDGASTAVRAAAYEWSVSTSRRMGFDALWATAVGA